MSPDPYIQYANNVQSYNRYGYLMNNPFAGADPSGYKIKLGKIFKVVAIAAAAWYAGALVANALEGAAIQAGASTTFATISAASCNATATLTAAGSALAGATGGFVGGFLASGGDLGFAMKSGTAGAITGAFATWGTELAGTPGNVIGKSLGSGISAQAAGGDFASGIKYGLLGALKSEAYAYMTRETDRLATAWWGTRDGIRYDEVGRLWTYGNRGCAAGGNSYCSTLFPRWLIMDTEPQEWERVSRVPLVGAFVNSVSKTHDWLNNALTNVYDPVSGGARNFDIIQNTVIDVISTAGMVPAAVFTARALYSSPLDVSGSRH